jgi:hypothetical protein
MAKTILIGVATSVIALVAYDKFIRNMIVKK